MDSSRTKNDKEKIKIDFLGSYYTQDGNHSPVTGGIGTEQLTDAVAKVKVYVPIKKGQAISVLFGSDTYSSASTDNINDAVSSASAQDTRTYGNLDYTWTDSSEAHSYSVGVGFSTEYDVQSASANFSYSFLSKDQNTGFKVSAYGFRDDWSLIYPTELRARAAREGALLSTNVRKIAGMSVTWVQTLNKKNKLALTAEYVRQQGLLSTPFHRVYFSDITGVDIERLPQSRNKFPLSLRLNSYLNDYIILRSFVRYYQDDFAINALTAKVEMPIRFTPWLSAYPFFRYSQQTASKYFAPKAEHLSTSTFYSSDYDLSAFQSTKYGIGLKVDPLLGLARWRLPLRHRQLLMWRSVDLRYGHYQRSDGLKADIISIRTSFEY